ncbi:hypothetical protein B0H13DRAFT_2667781 [Mycena leptocephala]|nr:hypothetical protein B0H13DRAFT_2667781 [Mycena leptocephala]
MHRRQDISCKYLQQTLLIPKTRVDVSLSFVRPPTTLPHPFSPSSFYTPLPAQRYPGVYPTSIFALSSENHDILHALSSPTTSASRTPCGCPCAGHTPASFPQDYIHQLDTPHAAPGRISVPAQYTAPISRSCLCLPPSSPWHSMNRRGNCCPCAGHTQALFPQDYIHQLDTAHAAPDRIAVPAQYTAPISRSCLCLPPSSLYARLAVHRLLSRPSRLTRIASPTPTSSTHPHSQSVTLPHTSCPCPQIPVSRTAIIRVAVRNTNCTATAPPHDLPRHLALLELPVACGGYPATAACRSSSQFIARDLH